MNREQATQSHLRIFEGLQARLVGNQVEPLTTDLTENEVRFNFKIDGTPYRVRFDLPAIPSLLARGLTVEGEALDGLVQAIQGN